jgi:hypothetical protein
MSTTHLETRCYLEPKRVLRKPFYLWLYCGAGWTVEYRTSMLNGSTGRGEKSVCKRWGPWYPTPTTSNVEMWGSFLIETWMRFQSIFPHLKRQSDVCWHPNVLSLCFPPSKRTSKFQWKKTCKIYGLVVTYCKCIIIALFNHLKAPQSSNGNTMSDILYLYNKLMCYYCAESNSTTKLPGFYLILHEQYIARLINAVQESAEIFILWRSPQTCDLYMPSW